ncbi:MAG: hypothetical protein NVSMB55_28020 [Mycobacteriales bacterium]
MSAPGERVPFSYAQISDCATPLRRASARCERPLAQRARFRRCRAALTGQTVSARSAIRYHQGGFAKPIVDPDLNDSVIGPELSAAGRQRCRRRPVWLTRPA